jgi:EAL and modified HD-GYP domain-containing signal transduction protein
LINLLLAGAEFQDIEDQLKQDPNLAISLLRLANSAATGVRVPVQSVRQALVVLGYRQTLRWVQLFLYAGESKHQPVTPLMTLAATRGRFLELLAARSPLLRADADHAFVVGVLSLLDALLGVPMEEVLRSITLTEDILAALRERVGALGTALNLVEAIERDDPPAVHQDALALAIPLEVVLPLRVKASYWAREVEKCCI